ncbi:hypothetical protein AWR36_004440 [Microbulbifer flavimaris]|uniref:Preprotein translocase subunit YajC n=1 Tax=Microbulbifer flavimaris TaxID=1781068 RepID=A0ABX4I3J2_9GAMM|nr:MULTISPECIES: hypothetical protein [Microbulbifer]KUJ84891.1 hypothetical protein AVO43_04440 [Microbulbifer sp. ZGT114]PCO06989.1 hypothetical protein AWR36_004440 [Microbulbifer flavimaris]
MSGWLPLLIILFAVALVVGPVMWMKPSDRDRKLAGLRQRAIRAGMTVKMKPLPTALGEGTAAVYYNRWEDPRRLDVGWNLELQRMSHDLHFSDRWDWAGKAAPEASWQLIRELLKRLPEDACAIHSTRGGLGIQWQERSGDKGFETVEQALKQMRPEIEEAIRQPAGREDARDTEQGKGPES